MAYTTIKKPSLHFNTKLYTGNGADNHAITGVGFAPDLVWQKRRDGSNGHVLFDKVRGATKIIQSDGSSAEITSTSGKDTVSLDSDGFTVAVPHQVGGINANSSSCVAWNWKANGSGSSNTDGSINTTSTSVNTTAGFSISKWTATGSASTIGHGLGAIPHVMIVKRVDGASDFIVYHHKNTSDPETDFLRLNTNVATQDNNTIWNDTAPTSSVFSIGTEFGNGYNYITYCFTEKVGYSKFGSYNGNGNVDGNFVYTGFKPAFVLGKRTDSAGGWWISDNKRSGGFNLNDEYLLADDSQAEADDGSFASDFLSNGFKCRADNGNFNTNGGTYIYMAFASEPLVGDNPATAR